MCGGCDVGMALSQGVDHNKNKTKTTTATTEVTAVTTATSTVAPPNDIWTVKYNGTIRMCILLSANIVLTYNDTKEVNSVCCGVVLEHVVKYCLHFASVCGRLTIAVSIWSLQTTQCTCLLVVYCW